MGSAKDEMLEWGAFGLRLGKDGRVCKDCVCDPGLADFITQNPSETFCDYCQTTWQVPVACRLSDLVKFMAEVIQEEWGDPTTELPFETREGGYQGKVLSASDLFDEVGFCPESEKLGDDVASYFMDGQWCRKDYFACNPAERQMGGWERFCLEVMHNRRYTFWNSFADGSPPHHPDYLPPAYMLPEIKDVITKFGLVHQVPFGARYWRVQDHDSSVKLNIPSRFTSPPREYALQPNRMSPAGIPMFYGAEDLETGIVEVTGDEFISGRSVTGIQFETKRILNVLDLINLDQYVSYFAPNGRQWRHWAEFLQFFSLEVSKPIVRDKQQHIAYVPTQVFTEYVRFYLSAADGSPVDGLRYLSSRNRQPCVVLFLDQEDCLRSRKGRPQTLAYVSGSEVTTPLDSRGK